MSEIRIDKLILPKVKKTKDGFLKGEAIITRTGVFEYLNLDGSIRKELRHPDDVFTTESLDTLKGIPITIEHPHNFVNVNNADQFLVGLTGDNIKIDNNYIISPVTITHKDGITAINKGKKSLSLGYTTQTIEEKGVYDGVEYTHRQTNIKYNHLSIVDQGRAGAQARLNLDSYNNALFSTTTITKQQHEDKMSENLDQEIEKAVKYSEMKMNYDSIKETLSKVEAERDHLRSELDQMKANRTDAVIATEAKKRVELLLKASKVLNLDSLMNKSDREIMTEVIQVKDKSINFDNKDDSYIFGRFDAIIESLNDNENLKKQVANIELKSDSNVSNNGKYDIMTLNKFVKF